MAGLTWRAIACNVLTQQRIGYVDLQDMAFNDPISGAGTLTGKAVLSPNQDRDQLAALTAPEQVSLYVRTADNWWFGGFVKGNPWDPANRWRTVTAVGWKAWLQERYIGPNATANPVTDITYGYTATEQLQIARNIINYATADVGCPSIAVGMETSGVTRDLNWLGSDFKAAADLIDSMATRTDGFDWTIQTVTDAIRNQPALQFMAYYPSRGSTGPALTFRKTPNGGNIIVDSEIQESSTDVRSRVWTSGSGSPPDQKWAYDQDPAVTSDTALLTETKTAYSSVQDVATLAANARAERVFRSTLTNTMQVKALFADIDPTLYSTGDRVQLIYSDEGIDLNMPSVRIVDIQWHVNTTNGADYALITLDLSDDQLPDNTTAA